VSWRLKDYGVTDYVYNPGNSIEFPWGKWLKEVETGVKWLKEVGNRCKVASKKWKLV
jgi:hypothetical protein